MKSCLLHVFLLVLVYANTFVLAQNERDCYFTSKTSLTSITYTNSLSNLRACLSKIPIESNVIQQTLKVAEHVLDAYSFEHLNKNSAASGSSYDIKVDARQKIADMHKQSFTSAFHFHSELCKLFNSFYDAHTRYFMPQPYKGLDLFIPLPLSIVESGGSLSVFVKPPSYISDLQSNYDTVNNLNSQYYYNRVITAINNKPPIQFLNELALFNPVSKDPSARLNSILQTRYISFNNIYIPDFEEMVIQFSNGEVQKFPIMVYMDSAKNGTMSFISQTTARNSRALIIDNKHSLSVDPSNYYLPNLERQTENKRKRNVNELFNVIDNTTVIQISTFSPSSISLFHQTIIAAVEDAKVKNTRNLLLDLQGNGGGRICLAISLLNYLISDFSKLEEIDGSREFKQNSILPTIFPASLYLDRFLEYGTKKVKDRSFFTSNGISKDFGNVQALYSEPFSLNCESSLERSALFPKNATYFFENIILLTDGLCGSACSLFATKLKLYNKARIYNIGGGSNGVVEPFESSSFCGGLVKDYRVFGDSLPKLNLTNAGFTVNVQHVYFNNMKLPREFIKIVADGALPTWDFQNYKKILALIKEFERNRILSIVLPILAIIVLILVVAIVVGVVFLIRRRRLSRKTTQSTSMEEPLNDTQYYSLNK